MDNFEEAARIWREHVPQSGQALTVEGELIRAIEKLRDEAMRNGNGNWDAGFEILLAYLGEKLTDPKAFTPDVVSRNRSLLSRLRMYDRPCLEDELFDELTDRAVDYFHYYGSQAREVNPRLHR